MTVTRAVRSKDSLIAEQRGPSAVVSVEKRSRWAFYVFLLLGFGIRLHGLTFHSLWLDEAVSVYLASFPSRRFSDRACPSRNPTLDSIIFCSISG